MSQYYGDIDLGDTIQWLFTTVNTSGVPTILTGSPTATAYTDGGITQSATGVTLTADFDGVTGLNLMSVVATSGNGFASGENIEIVLDAGTVGGNSVVGYAVGSFSIENRSALRPTTAGNTLDVSATGEAGIDWANIGSPTTAQNLSGTNIDVDQVVASVSGAVGSVTGAVGSVTAAVTVDTISANVITASALATDAVDEIVDQVWDELMAGHVTADTAGLIMNEWQDGGRLDLILDARMAEASINTTGGAVDTVTTATNVTTVNGLAANVITAASINASAMNGKGDWNIGKTGYSLTQAFPTNFSDLTIAVTTGYVDVGSWLGTSVTAATAGRPDVNIEAINDSTEAAIDIKTSALTIVRATVDTVINGHTPTQTEFQADDVTEATTDHFKGRVALFTSGALKDQGSDITGYALVGGIGQFTVNTMTDAPANNDTFVIV
jgi:hypothetical protein